MYVWQMNDGSWNVSMLTGERGLFTRILQNSDAYLLYANAYRTERDARAAEARIRALLA